MVNDSVSKLTIKNREIVYKTTSVDIQELNFYPRNPRIATILAEHKEQLTNDLIDEKLWNRDETHVLFKSIKKDGGLLHPIIVYKNDVLEGNTRLCCYRHLYAESKDEKWKYINCNIIIDDLSHEDIYRLLCIEHIQGKNEWEAYEKANLYCKMKDEEKMTPEKISELVGESSVMVRHRIKAYQMMVENGVIDKAKYSHFEQLVTNSKIQQIISKEPAIQAKIVDAIKDGKVSTAQDVRKIPDVLKHKEAKKRFIQDGQNLNQVYTDLKAKAPMTDSPFMKEVEDMITRASKLKREEREGIKNNNRDKNKIEQLTKELLNLCKELDIKIYVPKNSRK